MEKNSSMKAYMDSKNRLILVIDNPAAGISEFVKLILGGNVPEVQHLNPPEPMTTPDIDTAKMKEMTSIESKGDMPKTPKFVRKNQAPATSAERQEEPDIFASAPTDSDKREDIPATQLTKSVDKMCVFELKKFIRSKSGHSAFQDILMTEAKSTNIDFVLNVKSEKALREIARRLAS